MISATKSKQERQHAGVVEVDSAQLWLGDPCNLVGKSPMELLGGDTDAGVLQAAFDNGAPGLGVRVDTIGDGVLPVFVQRSEFGRITAVQVRLEYEEQKKADPAKSTPVDQSAAAGTQEHASLETHLTDCLPNVQSAVSPAITLRPYQEAAIRAVWRYLKQARDARCAEQPIPSGYTLLADRASGVKTAVQGAAIPHCLTRAPHPTP